MTQSTIVMIELNQQEGAEPLDDVARAETAKNALEAAGFKVTRTMVIAQQGGVEVDPSVFSKTEPEVPTIPYQSNARLVVGEGAAFLDVVTETGHILTSFPAAEVRKIVAGLKRTEDWFQEILSRQNS